MFRDRVRLKLKAGNGGNGKVSFGFGHMPAGGTGGNGGNIYIEGSNNIFDLNGLKPDHVYEAENGEHGGIKNLTGANGEDRIIRVPLTTKVYNDDKELIATISENGQRELVLKGGVGGLGNYYFRKGGALTINKSTEGYPGERTSLTFVLELQSDIIFIGLPNAGKSSILNSLTNANSEVAAYPFTTLIPHLGRMGEITLMDLPGLIEFTSKGKGLGSNFVKHTRSAKKIAHFISLESDDPVRDYELIRNEIKELSHELAAKPEFIVLTKSDLIKTADLPAKIKLFKKYKKPVIAVSAYDIDGLEKLRELFSK